MTTENPERDLRNEVADLRDELESLRERVRRIEQSGSQDDVSPSADSAAAIDHRDAAVLSVVENRADEPKPIELVRLYKQETDVVNRDTAKQRAKSLRQTDAYREAVQK